MMMHSPRRALLALLFTFVLALGAVAYLASSTGSAAQDTAVPAAADMSGRLAEISRRLQDEDGFSVTFQFRSFFADYNAVQADPDPRAGSVLTIPYRSPNGEVTVRLGEIGADHVCFNETRGEARSVRCVLYSDVVSVVYPA